MVGHVLFELVGDHPTGDPSAHRWEIDNLTIIGRGGEASIVLNVPAVSRHHVQVVPRPDGWWVADLDSRNGTFLNGDQLRSDPVRLNDGDELVVAGVATLRFIDPLATPLSPAIGRLTGVWIDPDSKAVWVDARRVEPPLSARQLALLELLDAADGEIVTRSDAIDSVWEDAAAEGVTDDALAALIKRLRKRLEPFENGEPNVEIVRHRGIRLRNVG